MTRRGRIAHHNGLEMTPSADQSRAVHQAFILGAGLGTRLRPITDHLPKPLVPLFHRPLVEWVLDACVRTGVRRIAINTHHLAAQWERSFGHPLPPPAARAANRQPVVRRQWHDHPVDLFHEPELLETGGGLKNIEDWLEDGTLLVHNADIYSSMSLEALHQAHQASGLPVTLALRSAGEARHVALDAGGTRVADIRGLLGTAAGTHVFAGVYCVERSFLEILPARQKVSVIPAFLELAKAGALGAVVLDDGQWCDLGDRRAYLHAHQQLNLAPLVHPRAIIESGAVVENSCVGPQAVVGGGAVVRNSVVWPACRVASGAVLDDCVVCSGREVTGRHQGAAL